MAEKILNSRIINKHDIEANWLKKTTFIPKQGEIIVYDIDASHNYERLKIGDGKTVVSSLPFVDGALKDYVDKEVAELSEDISAMDALVGDTSVSSQITSAIANKSDVGHVHDDRYYTESEIDTKLNGKSNTGHTHSAYVNQNAFSNVAVGSTTIAADSTTDTLTLVAGSNITLTPDATNDKVTITATDTVYTHPNSGVTAGTYKSVTVNAQGHVTGGTNPTTLAGYGITDAAAKSHKHTASEVGADAAGSAASALTSAKSYTDSQIDAMVGDEPVSDQISAAVETKSDTNHTHKYAGSSSVGGAATSADKLNTDAGSATQPVYFDNGVPVATTYTLGASVPSGAKFTDTVYTHPSYTSKASGLYKIGVDNKGHVSATTAVVKADITALGIPAQDTTYDLATVADDGLMSAADKLKLNGIATGATKIIVDNALSSNSTNPVQNKVVNAAITSLNALVGDTEVSTQINNAIATKSDTGHTHNYAGSSSAGGAATSANKINTDAGSATQPVYFANGVPVKTTHTLGASVPSGAKFTDTVYTHPTTSGNKHIPSGGSSGQILRWSADGTAVWGADNDTTYSEATASSAGLMSAADKATLDELKVLVGDESVSTQISNTIADKADKSDTLYIGQIADDDVNIIPSGADLNNYTTPGAYRCISAEVAGSLVNAPSYTSAGFRLVVTATSTATNACMQLAIFNVISAPRIYWRIYSTTRDDWSPWYRQASVEYGTAEYTAGTTALATGSIYVQYE